MLPIHQVEEEGRRGRGTHPTPPITMPLRTQGRTQGSSRMMWKGEEGVSMLIPLLLSMQTTTTHKEDPGSSRRWGDKVGEGGECSGGPRGGMGLCHHKTTPTPLLPSPLRTTNSPTQTTTTCSPLNPLPMSQTGREVETKGQTPIEDHQLQMWGLGEGGRKGDGQGGGGGLCWEECSNPKTQMTNKALWGMSTRRKRKKEASFRECLAERSERANIV